MSDAPSDWTPIVVAMPPEGVIVDSLSAGGELLRVKWEGRLWRLPTGAHHPCYTPEYWRTAAGNGVVNSVTGSGPRGGGRVRPDAVAS